MSKEAETARAARLMVIGLISEQPPEKQQQFHEAKAAIRRAIADHGEMGEIALSVIMCEVTEAAGS